MSLKDTYWLVYVDTSWSMRITPTDPIRVKATSQRGAFEAVNKICLEEGHGELDVGAIGLVKIVKESNTRSNEDVQ